MFCNDDGIRIDCKEEQYWNAYFSIPMIELGRLTDVNAEQLENAFLPIRVNDEDEDDDDVVNCTVRSEEHL